MEYETLLTALNLKSNEFSSLRSMQEVMGPWPAPFKNSNDYGCCTYDQKRSKGHPSDITNILLIQHGATSKQLTLKANRRQI